MSQEEIKVAPEATPQKRGPGRPKKEALIPKVRKPYGMKDSEVFEGKTPKASSSKQYRGFCGQCVKIKIPSNNGEPRFPSILDVKLGDLPAVHILVNREVIVPTEILGVLNDTAVEIPAPGILAHDSGPRDTETFVRIPVQVFGTATWDEYEAFLAKERPKPIVPTKVS